MFFVCLGSEKKKKFALVSSNQGLGHRSFFLWALWKCVKKKSEAAHKDSVCFYTKHGSIVMIYDVGMGAEEVTAGDKLWIAGDLKLFSFACQKSTLVAWPKKKIFKPKNHFWDHDKPLDTPLLSLEADDKVIQDWSINSIHVSKMISSDWQFLHIFAS